MLFTTLAFIVGLVYGYAKPGKENRWGLFKKGIVYGLILGVILGVIGFFVGGPLLFAASAIGIFIEVVFLVIIFIIGTFIGDLVEAVLK